MKGFFRTHVGFLMWGIAFWFPIAVVAFVLSFLLGNIESIGRSIFLLVFPERYFYQGLGIALGLVIIYVSGVVLKTTKIRSKLSKIPILGLFFGGGDVITVERLINLTPCLFLYSPTMPSYGWILSEEKVTVGETAAPFTLLNVYYPNVPTLVTGQVFPVRKETVMKLGNSSKEVIDLLLYAFRSPAALEYVPWDGESADDFEARSALFGITLGRGQNGGSASGGSLPGGSSAGGHLVR